MSKGASIKTVYYMDLPFSSSKNLPTSINSAPQARQWSHSVSTIILPRPDHAGHIWFSRAMSQKESFAQAHPKKCARRLKTVSAKAAATNTFSISITASTAPLRPLTSKPMSIPPAA